MPLAFIHARIGLAGSLFLFLAGLYALYLYFRQSGVDGNLRGMLVIGEVLFIIMAVLGTIMALEGAHVARWVHYLYGILMVILIPSAFAITQGRDGRREVLVYAVLALFMGVMAYTRAMTTG